MKKLVEYIFIVGLSGIVIYGLLSIIMSGHFLKDSDRQGIFEMVGALSTEEGADTSVSDNYIQDLDDIQIEYKSSSKTLKTKTEINFKALFKVKSSSSSSFADGDTEDTFQIYVNDIMLKDGTSIYQEAIQKDEDSSDENSKPLYYDSKNGMIVFYNAGVYKFSISVNDNNGVEINKTFFLVADDI